MVTRSKLIPLAVGAMALATPLAAREKAQPVTEVAKPCPSQGAGFVRVPGSATCMRVSGRATAGIDARAARGDPAVAPVAAGRLAIDTRTESEWGPVRTFVRVGHGVR